MTGASVCTFIDIIILTPHAASRPVWGWGRRWRRDCRRRRYFLFLLCPNAQAQTPAAVSASPLAASKRGTLPTIRVTARHAKLRVARRKPRQTEVRGVPSPPTVLSDAGARNVAGGPAIEPTTASQMTVSRTGPQQPGGDAAWRNPRSCSGPGGGFSRRRRQGQPVLPARLQSRSRHRFRRLCRRHADQPADARPRPGLCRSQLADAGNGRQPRHPQGSVLRRCRRFCQRRLACSSICATVSTRKSSKRRQAASITTGFSRWDRPRLGGGSLLYAAEANTYDGPWTVA